MTKKEIIKIIEEKIIEDKQIIVETPENKFARTKVNSVLKDILFTINN